MSDEAAALRALLVAEQANRLRLAQLAGVSRATVYNFLAGGRAPRVATLRKIAAGFRLLRAEASPPLGLDTAAEHLEREARYVTALDARTARERARALAADLLVRATATKDLQLVRDQVAHNLESTIQASVGDDLQAARLGLARVAVESGEYERTLALTAAVPETSRRHWLVARWIAAEALRMQGRWPEARAAATDALRSPDPAVRAWAQWNLAKVADKVGDDQGARRAFQAALRVARSAGITDWERADIEGWTHWGLGWVELRVATPDDALAAFREASRVAPEGDAGLRLWIGHGLGQLLALTGELDEARDIYRAAIVLARAIGNEHYTAWMSSSLAEIALTQGAYDAAARWADRAVATYDAHVGPNAPSRAWAAALSLFAGGVVGRPGWGAVATGLRALAGAEGASPSARCSVLLLVAEAERRAGAAADAAASVTAAIALAEAHRLALREAHGRLAHATMLLERSVATADPRPRAEGRAALRQAQRTFESMQSAWGTVRCLMLRRSYGLRVDEAKLGQLVRGRYPVKAAELGLLAAGVVPAAPLLFPGD